LSAYLTILGYNSAIPTTKSFPTSQFLEMSDRCFLIDCGEGTQVQLRRAKVKFSKINNIFISHLHGDHCFGLPGLVSSFSLLGRTNDLNIFGPKGIKKMLEIIFRVNETDNHGFKIFYHELQSNESQKIFDDEKLEVWTIPLNHRIYCNGYLFKEKIKERVLNIEEISKYSEIQKCDYHNFKNGKDFILSDGYILKNELLTMEPKVSLSYAFCSDTRFKEDIVPIIKNVDLLYHEATFLDDFKKKANLTGHSTAKEAAIIAQKAGVKKLILGHFSNRYENLEVFLDESRKYFPNTFLPEVLQCVEI